MPVRSRRLGVLTAIAPGATVALLSVPANRTAIVKHLTAVGRTTASVEVTFYLRTAEGLLARLSGPVAATAGTFWRYSSEELVLNPGDELLVVADGGNGAQGIDIVAAGSLLDGAPA